MSKYNVPIIINNPESSLAFNPLDLLHEPVISTDSPIDEYFNYSASLIVTLSRGVIGSDQSFLAILGAITGTEYYFRNILSKSIQVCPLCNESSSKHMISRGSIDYYKRERVNFALLENTSFTGAAEIRRATTNFAGVNLNQDSSVEKAIADYESVCTLRHAAVHSRSYINSTNAREIGSFSQGERAIEVDAAKFQDIMSICSNVVRAYNSFLFKSLIDKWIDNDVLAGEWSKDWRAWGKLFSIFACNLDNANMNPRFEYAKVKIIIDSRRAGMATRRT